MTGYERMKNVLEGRPTDILPYTEGFENMQSRSDFFGPAITKGPWEEIALLEAGLFESDWVIVPAPLNIPGGPGIFCDTIVDDDTHLICRTFYGGVWYWRKSPYYTMALNNPVRTEEDLDKLPEPDWDALRKRVARLRDPIKRIKDQGYFVAMEGKGSFESTWMLFRGMVETWVHTLDNPQFVKRMADRATEAIIRLGLMVADECEVDCIWITDDLGTQQSPYFSPETYRAVYKDANTRLVKAYHERGLKAMYHSHGNVMSLFQDMIDEGWDSIDPIDAYDGMDFRLLKEKHGQRIVLKGGLSCTIGRMSPRELEEHIAHAVSVGGRDRFILSSAGGVPPEMPLETFNRYRSLVHKARRGT
jgi:uroporphyrinogen-III decarboxylase